MDPLTCMLVDDDDDDQVIFKLALEGIDKPIQCIIAKSADEALELLKQEDRPLPDFIFLDLNMPRMNGRQCLVELKNTPRLRGIPVIIYSTSSEQRDKTETADLGASFFMTKPSNIDELSNTLFLFFQSVTTIS